MTEQKLIYEGKAKKIFSTGESEQLLMEFKDSLTAFNAQKKGQFAGKGKLNCLISTYIFKLLNEHKIPHHWLKTQSDNLMLVQRTKIIPLEVVVRNYLAGALAKKLKKNEGDKLTQPLVELYYKDDALEDPFVSDDQAIEFSWATAEQLTILKKMALEINIILSERFLAAGLKLIDFKVEFGVNQKNEILLADEISPDCMRLWDIKTDEKFDKDRFRRDLGNVEEAYQDVLTRLEKVKIC